MQTTLQETPLLLTEKECSKLLRCCERTVARMRQAGEIPFIRLRGAVRYSRSDILDFVQSQSQSVAK
jgi:excisionase family DNA binding protein